MKASSPFYRESDESEYMAKDYAILGTIFLVGVLVRFWGLGNVGLHGDEETTAMPVLQILKTGIPTQPAGFLYLRAIGQSYLMALSVLLFGVTEWALRFPSAIVGSLGVVISYFLGRNFLPPRWNILFVSIVALYPSFITLSQTARMYIFLLTFLMLFAVLVCRWDRRDTWGDFTLSFFTFLLCLQFHVIAIFSSFLFFFPFLIKPTKKRFFQGGLAFFVGFIAFYILKEWIGAQYGVKYSKTLPAVPQNNAYLTVFTTVNSFFWPYVLSFLCLIPVAMCFHFRKEKDITFLFSLGLFIAGIMICFALQYVLALLFICCGLIVYLRANGKINYFVMIVCSLGILFGYQIYILYNSVLFGGVEQVLKTLVIFQKPSLFMFRAFLNEFLFSTFLYLIVFLYFVRKIINVFLVPGSFLLFILTVAFPLFCFGFFSKGYIPDRYFVQVFPFFILCVVSGVYILYKENATFININNKVLQQTTNIVMLLIFINPLMLVKSINPSYEYFPDHKGAAEYLKKIKLKENDIVIAEDVLQQTYYLGKVDFWLRKIDRAKFYVKKEGGALYDLYTNTPLIGTAEDLAGLISNYDKGAIYIIGSGETAGNSTYIDEEMLRVINQRQPEIVFRGRDGKTYIKYIPRKTGS